MPSSKSVRFEDLDDGVDDGLYGMKGILKNLYTQAGSYRKWVRSHSKKSCKGSSQLWKWRKSRSKNYSPRVTHPKNYNEWG
ncbi:hypothetical protein NGA_0443500 [Nannochloropsis gaditana CCMP526]|uniref:uncharacterized protein n=1 Tax=Nannochloropsis gaditana (strain CCMP526) TaxID=1093141 RepID=UPI00029F66BC|nr:hypothetical protein NGA_0443500 [Nannochloropsis gaditana CCMP526]EKU22545.1 hypothetical protein NGA_0443500 [Nannochloropsis gaditana CCMP526]|eukprot:XP_005853819.1 hypothetical protein NGA_0443500 [Nannochloropsis gaditana CCMP526]